jgi:hypothetical protein
MLIERHYKRRRKNVAQYYEFSVRLTLLQPQYKQKRENALNEILQIPFDIGDTTCK